MYWNQETESVLKELWEQGVSSGLIAKELGCTRNAIIGKVHRLKLSTREPKMMVNSENPLPEVCRIRNTVYMKSNIPPPEMPFEPSPIGGVSLMELEPHHCRFIVGSSEDGLALYCGEPKHYGSYCDYHGRLCYHPHVFSR